MKKFFAIAIFACTSTLPAQTSVSIGVNIGTPPPPPRAYYAPPPTPGPGYVWVDGYWGVEAGRYMWFNGYWAQPPYVGAVWVAPRYDRGRWYKGYWNGKPGRHEGWDRGKGRGRGHRD